MQTLSSLIKITNKMFTVNTFWVNWANREVQPATISVANGLIMNIEPCDAAVCKHFAMPGFIDAHIHIESSMMLPSEFATLAVTHGTVGTVSDPHEIANVCGMEGVKYMIDNGNKVPFHFFFGAPSCVPATTFETSGAVLNAEDIDTLLQMPEILYLSEMMNFPGVIHEVPEVVKKIKLAHHYHKPIDGHAPGLRGEMLDKYINAGISTDHESFTYEEGLEKLKKGMKILIREGSAAKNFDALISLLADYPQMIMFCSDDKHPDELALGHINQLAARAVAKGLDVYDIIVAACINPINHYKLPIGKLQIADAADFILVEDLVNFKTVETYIKGQKVFDTLHTKCLFETEMEQPINNFNITEISLEQLQMHTHKANGKYRAAAIDAIEGQLVTGISKTEVEILEGQVLYPSDKLYNKICVINRYNKAEISMGFIKNFSIQNGAIASSVAHDSHNIVAVGDNDIDLLKAINSIIQMRGGISAASASETYCMALPAAGLMSNLPAQKVAHEYDAVSKHAKRITGTPLTSPYMTLSFMALPVIPSLKITDLGLFDVDTFGFVDLISE